MYQVTDARLSRSKALPNGAANTSTDAIDMENTTKASNNAPWELLISAPALTTAEQPNAKTLIYSVEMDDNAAFTSPTVLYAEVLRQTGAGGAGAAAASVRVKVPTNAERYVRVKATGSASGDSSAKSFTVLAKF